MLPERKLGRHQPARGDACDRSGYDFSMTLQRPSGKQLKIEADDGGSRSVGSIKTGGRVLQALVRSSRPMQLRELAEQVGMSPAQLHPYLVSFRSIDLIEQTGRGSYRLGPFALQLGLARMKSNDVYRETISRVAEFSEQLSMMVSVSVWGARGVTVVYIEQLGGTISSPIGIGRIYDISLTATGKLFAAHLPEAHWLPVLENELKASTLGFQIDMQQLRKSIDLAREQGFATTENRPVPGVSAIAAPVFDHTNRMQLAVTVSGQSGAFDLSRDGPVCQQLRAFTDSISRSFGYEG